MKKQKTETLLHYPDFVLEEPRNGYPRVRLSRPLVLKEGDRDETLRQFLLIHRRLRSRRIRSLDFLARLPENGSALTGDLWNRLRNTWRREGRKSRRFLRTHLIQMADRSGRKEIQELAGSAGKCLRELEEVLVKPEPGRDSFRRLIQVLEQEEILYCRVAGMLEDLVEKKKPVL